MKTAKSHGRPSNNKFKLAQLKYGHLNLLQIKPQGLWFLFHINYYSIFLLLNSKSNFLYQLFREANYFIKQSNSNNFLLLLISDKSIPSTVVFVYDQFI